MEHSGWMAVGDGYALGIRDGSIVARSPKNKVMASVPKALKDTDVWETLAGAVEFLAVHRAECREAVETWMLRSLGVPRSVVQAVWDDPEWRRPLQNLVIVAEGTVGILRSVEERGVGVVNLAGETVWLTAPVLSVPHPILLGDLDDWRALLVELSLDQDCAQLFRETFAKPADPSGTAILTFAGGDFAMLTQAGNEARKLGYRVSGGCATCRVWERSGLVEGRYFIGDEDPMSPTTTGDLSWVDERQRGLDLLEIGAVAFSEGMRMASGIYAKRKLDTEGGDDV